MRRHVIIASVLTCALESLCLAPVFVAQAKASTVTLEDLRTPYSPAFVLLGIEPATVERPTNPKALALSVFGAIQNGGNLALEVAPYWLVDKPTLTFREYYEANPFEILLQTLSISAATSLNVDEGGTPGNDVASSGNGTGGGLGFRFSLVRGKPADDDVATLRKSAIDVSNLVLDRTLAERQSSAAGAAAELAKMNGDFTREAQLRAEQQEFANKVAAITVAIGKIAVETQSARERVSTAWRGGFTLDVAGGASGLFGATSGPSEKFLRAGAWMEPAYHASFEHVNLEAVAVGRYLFDEQAGQQDLIDLGGRLTAEFPDAVFHSALAVSFEGVYRLNASGSGDDTERLAGIFEYELPDSVQLGQGKYLTATFGQDFDDTTGDTRAIVLFGINFSFGETPQIQL